MAVGYHQRKSHIGGNTLILFFRKQNEVINLTSSAGETSSLWNEEDDDVENISNDGGQESDVDIDEENIQHSEDATTLDTGESQETSKQKIVVAPPIKRQQVRSNKQALKEVASSLKVMAETLLKALQNDGRGRQKKREEIHGISKRKEQKKSGTWIAHCWNICGSDTTNILITFWFQSLSDLLHFYTQGFIFSKPNNKTNKSWRLWSLSALHLIKNNIEFNRYILCNRNHLLDTLVMALYQHQIRTASKLTFRY